MESLLPNHRRHDVAFYRNGRIDILSGVAKRLGVEEGDVIDVARNGGEFFLYVRLKSSAAGAARYMGRVRRTKSGGRNFRAWCKPLADAVLRECGAPLAALLPVGDIVKMENGLCAAVLITRLNLSR